jgi:hypothetical protein
VRLPSLAATAALAILVGAALTGCSTTVNLEPAEGAEDPACAEVTVRLPGSVADQPRLWTDAQATGAWGAQTSSVLLRCGVTPPGPTEAKCITLGGVDWVVDESQAPRYLVTTYGRVPAVEVFIDNETVSPNDVLSALGVAVSAGTTSERACTLTETLVPED